MLGTSTILDRRFLSSTITTSGSPFTYTGSNRLITITGLEFK